MESVNEDPARSVPNGSALRARCRRPSPITRSPTALW